MNKISGLLCALSLPFVLAGCVFDDLSHCPTDGVLTLSMSYGADAVQSAPLPLERAGFYVFDSGNRFVCSLTDEEGPFTSGHEYHVPLPEDTYTVVSWGNLHERLAVSPEPFIPGQTTLDEARVRLAGTALPVRRDTGAGTGDISGLPTATGPDKSLYCGMEQSIRVRTGQTTRAVIPLKRDTKVITLSVRYNRADGTPCDDPSHHPDACIRTADGIFKFDNSLSACGPFRLESTRRDDHIPNGFDAVFHKMTLRLDEPAEPEIILTAPGNPAEVVYKESLMEWLKGTAYDTQEKLDRTNEYLVELRFTCTHGGGDTHTTIRIFVNGWEYVPIHQDL